MKMCVPITVFGLLVKDEHGRLASGLVNLLCVYGIGRHLQSAACELLLLLLGKKAISELASLTLTPKSMLHLNSKDYVSIYTLRLMSILVAEKRRPRLRNN